MIKFVKEVKKPDVLVVTPLLTGHKISKETKRTLKRNAISYDWISSEGDGNIPTNLENGLIEYEKKKGSIPDYYIMIDRDIVAGRNLIDRLYSMIKNSDDQTAFTYASFKFRGFINIAFPADDFDINRLMRSNYISSNSMFKTKITKEVGLVKDEKYKRLLDWAFMLKLYYNGYYGIPCKDATFIAQSTKSDVSAGTQQDYTLKHKRVSEDFIIPIINKFSK